MISDKIKEAVRDIPDFPNSGIVFKDITPILKQPKLCKEIIQAFSDRLIPGTIDVVAGVESRGFLFGVMLASYLDVPFVPIRKSGKLPYKTVEQSYDLEYGSASIEMHADAIEQGQNVLIHDDLLATGGTVVAASKLIQQCGGIIAGYTFIINLSFLQGTPRIQPYSSNIIALTTY